jgi:hypothetical protein
LENSIQSIQLPLKLPLQRTPEERIMFKSTLETPIPVHKGVKKSLDAKDLNLEFDLTTRKRRRCLLIEYHAFFATIEMTMDEGNYI